MWLQTFWGDTKQSKTKFFSVPKRSSFWWSLHEQYLLPNSLLLFENPNLNEVPAQFCPPLSHHHTLLVTIFVLAAALVPMWFACSAQSSSLKHANNLINFNYQSTIYACTVTLVGYGSLIPYTFHHTVPVHNQFHEEYISSNFRPHCCTLNIGIRTSYRSYRMVYLTYNNILVRNHFSVLDF